MSESPFVATSTVDTTMGDVLLHPQLGEVIMGFLHPELVLGLRMVCGKVLDAITHYAVDAVAEFVGAHRQCTTPTLSIPLWLKLLSIVNEEDDMMFDLCEELKLLDPQLLSSGFDAPSLRMAKRITWTFSYLLQHVIDIEVLSLKGLMQVPRVLLDTPESSLSTLQQLHLGHVEITVEQLDRLLTPIVSLKDFSMDDLRDPYASAVAARCGHSLESLSCISRCNCSRILNACTKVTHLSVRACSLSSKDLVSLVDKQQGEFPFAVLSLTDVAIGVPGGLARLLGSCHDLEALTLSGTTAADGAVLAALRKNCPKLHTVDLTCDASGAQVECFFAKVGHQLRRVAISSLHSGATVTPLHSLATHCSVLETLSIAGCCDVDDVSLKALGRCCPNLRVFKASSASSTGDDGLKALAIQCRHLQSLELSALRGISGDGLHAASGNLPWLKELSVRITDTLLAASLSSALLDFQCLETLTVFGSASLQLPSETSSVWEALERSNSRHHLLRLILPDPRLPVEERALMACVARLPRCVYLQCAALYLTSNDLPNTSHRQELKEVMQFGAVIDVVYKGTKRRSFRDLDF